MKNKLVITPPSVVRLNHETDIKDVSVEPANWWVGMKEPRVTLMLHGLNVATGRVSFGGNGIKVVAQHQTDSINYLFVDIEIAPDAEPGSRRLKIEKDGRVVSSFDFELRQRRRDSDKRSGISSADALYLLIPDRFARGPLDEKTQAEADAMLEQPHPRNPQGRHGGTLSGIRQHLDYIFGLGMTALWTTPVLRTDMPRKSYHGYAITDFYSIDPRLGSLADYRLLVAALHQRGMKMVMDLVLNHCGTCHPWLADAPSSDWFNAWEGTPQLTNYRPDVMADVHASSIDRRRTVEGWFDSTMADLNLSNPLVRTYLAQVAIWWIETADLDSLRIDTYPYSDAEAMNLWTRRVKAEYPDMMLIGETWLPDSAKVAMWQRGSRLSNSLLDIPMDFPLQSAISSAFNEPYDWNSGADKLYQVIANDFLYDDPSRLLIFGDNHDTGRLFSRLYSDDENFFLALTFLATTRGIPQVYYGTECGLLMDGDSKDGDANIRQDFPSAMFSEDSLPFDAEEYYLFVKDLFTFRKSSPALQHGRLVHFLPHDNVYIFFRLTDSQRIMVILNLESQRMTLYAASFEEILGKTLSGRDFMSGKKYRNVEKFIVQPHTPYLIILSD